jgi:BlaR1 peptidase M56
MIPSLLPAFLFNVFINSLLMFLTLVVCIEGLFFLLRVKSTRLRYFCRLIPLIKLPVDFSLYDFSNWALTQGINPYSCVPDSRFFRVSLGYLIPDRSSFSFPLQSGISLATADGQTFSLADLSYLLHDRLFSHVLLALLLCTTGVYVIRSIRFWQTHQVYKKLLFSLKECPKWPYHLALIQGLARHRITLFVTPHKYPPFAKGGFHKAIVFPEVLMEHLTQEEFEAILAHEIVHMRWKDPSLKLGIQIIKNLFWWIPLKRWIKKLENELERACDTESLSLGIRGDDLASALVKTLKWTTPVCFPRSSTFANKKEAFLRVKALLKPEKRQKYFYRCLQGGILGVIGLTLLFGKFWIF